MGYDHRNLKVIFLTLICCFLGASSSTCYAFDVRDVNGSIQIRENQESEFVPLTAEKLLSHLKSSNNDSKVLDKLGIPSGESSKLIEWLGQSTELPLTHALIDAFKTTQLAGPCQRRQSDFSGIDQLSKFVSSELAHSFPNYSEIEPRCSVSFYMGIMNETSSMSPQEKEELWQAIDNHDSDISKSMSNVRSLSDDSEHVSELIRRNTHCPSGCDSTTLNSVYESFLAKNVLKFFKTKNVPSISSLFDKILDKLRATDPASYEGSLKFWLKAPDTFEFPVSQGF